jgi:dTDP-4-amino-4,6-dideoxygalactose transaminase
MTTATSRLGIKGGEPVRSRPFPLPPALGDRERQAVNAVLDSGVLSQFVGVWSEDFYGGPRVRSLERTWAQRVGAKHAIAMNSATSALNAAAAAAGVGPGDEVICSPYTMSASAVCALVNGAIPVFADIEPDTFCLDPASVERLITPRTKAIVAVDIFGCPADYARLNALAEQHGLVVIEDAAQAPGAQRNGKYAGTLGHIGVFSLNYHKTIHCGEGGVAVTDDDKLAERLALVRNHGEVVVGDMGSDASDILGFNYRMGEIEAAIAEVQLSRLDELTDPRIEYAQRIADGLADLEGITAPHVPENTKHVFYAHAIKLDPELGVSRDAFAAALNAEGIPIRPGYVAPIYRQPLYRDRTSAAFGDPRNEGLGGDPACPTCERIEGHEILLHTLVHAGLSEDDVDDLINAFRKVHAKRGEL